MNFTKLKSKKLLILVGAFVLVVLCLAITLLLLQHNKIRLTKTISVSTKKNNQPTKISKPTSSQVEVVEGTISPGELLKSPNNYVDKNVRVIGVIVEIEGKYRIIDQSGKVQGAILLSTNNNIDLKKYTTAYKKTSSGTYIIKPVVVDAKFSLTKQSISEREKLVTPTLQVTSVE